ncbi:hypothetical protein TSUD_281830 [Trifolium subterraneum]|uniref:Uncharacterized protein n=1 Tax=Trifolium subterraneum TaxID=3900 RepID=A0A1B5Z7E1_TRISU|nr:hypothetical protein TSUD_281830 [Trifolium subterraneum]
MKMKLGLVIVPSWLWILTVICIAVTLLSAILNKIIKLKLMKMEKAANQQNRIAVIIPILPQMKFVDAGDAAAEVN